MNVKIFSVLVLVGIVLSLTIGVSGATWCDNDFTKRINLSVNNTGGGALSDYQIYVNLSPNPINASSMRVYNTTSCNIRPHWSENITGGNSYGVWINYSAIAASAWTNNTAIYYNNIAASSTSEGDTTFIFFDDFPGSSLNTTTKWTIDVGDPVVDSGYVNLTGDRIHTQLSFPYNTSTRLKVDPIVESADQENVWGFGTAWFGTYQTGRTLTHESANEIQSWTKNLNEQISDIHRNGTTNVIFIEDGATKNTHSTQVPSGNEPVKLSTDTLTELWCDWVVVRKYEFPEPTWMLGSIESLSEYNISGYVKNSSGIALENVYVANNITSDYDYTNSSGYYILSSLVNNTYNVSAQKMRYCTNYTTVVVSGTDQTNQNITLNSCDVPPTPINIQYTRGYTWLNYTWSVGSGNITDSYNISVNGVWDNGSTNTYKNTAGLSQDTWVNISIYAFNNSCYKCLSKSNLSDQQKTSTIYVSLSGTVVEPVTNPVFSYNASSNWDDANVVPGTVLDMNGITVNGTLITGEYWMWYAGWSSLSPATADIGLAISTDGGKSWQRTNNGEHVISHGGGGWKDWYLSSPDVIWNGTGFQMWAWGGSTGGYDYSTGYFESIDGMNWTEYAGNPILEGSESWETYNTYKYAYRPCVIYNAFGRNEYNMWYNGYDYVACRIGYANGSTPTSFTKYSGNPVIDKGSAGSYDDEDVCEHSVFKIGSKVFIVYCAASAAGSDTHGNYAWATTTDGTTCTKKEYPFILRGNSDSDWNRVYEGKSSWLYNSTSDNYEGFISGHNIPNTHGWVGLVYLKPYYYEAFREHPNGISDDPAPVPDSRVSEQVNVTITENNVSLSSTGYEVLTVYTEVDPNAHLTVTTNKVTGGMWRNEDAYLYKDFGVDYFDALNIQFEMECTGGDSNGLGVFFALSNTINDVHEFGSTDLWVSFEPWTTKFLRLNRNATIDTYNAALSTTYYCTLNRTSGNDEVELEIRTGSHSGALVDTLNVTGFGTAKWRYLYAMNTRNTASATYVNGWTQNIDLTPGASGLCDSGYLITDKIAPFYETFTWDMFYANDTTPGSSYINYTIIDGESQATICEVTDNTDLHLVVDASIHPTIRLRVNLTNGSSPILYDFNITYFEGDYVNGTTPVISNVVNGSVNSTAQYVDWDVNQTAHNRVLYSNESDLTPAWYSTWDNSTNAPNITLSGLTASTQYWYQARSYNTTNTSLSDNSSTMNFTTAAESTYIPPDPTTLANTTGNFWINHTWNNGTGNKTDSYNVSVNTTWYNTTTNKYYNNTGLSAHGWSNITIYAFNSTGTGVLSNGNISQDTQVPNNAVSISNCSNKNVIETQNIYVDIDSSDTDSDTPTYSCNRTDLFTDFSSSTGKGNWSTDTLDNGTYYVNFGVADGYSSTDNCTVTIEVAEGTPTVPTNLNYALSNGNTTINWTWDEGSNTDKTNATLNGTAIGNITSPYEYTNNTLPRWENLSIRGYNSTTDEFSGWLNETVYVLAPTTPTLHIGNAINIKEDWGRDFNSNLSANVTGTNASIVWINFTNVEFTNTSLGWLNLTLDEWVNESHNVNAPVTNTSINVYLNSTTSGATNDSDSFWYEITNRTNTATMDSAATQNVDTSETFYVNATCNEEYGDTFLGAANLLEDGTIIDTDTTVTNYVNFSHSESSTEQYNYTIRFYNLTHYNNITTPTYSNVTVSDAEYTPPDATNLQNTTGNYYVNYTWVMGAPGNITDSYNVSWNLSWFNGTLTTYMQKEVGASNWGNITVYAYNSSGNGTLSSGSLSDNVQAPAFVPGDYIPATPTTLANSTGNYWVNFTWSSGGGANVTDSYNVSWNATWYNTTLTAYMQKEVGPSNWGNITVYAYNTSGNGSLSAGYITDDVQAPAYVPGDYIPADPITLANTTGNYYVNYTWSTGGGVNNTDSYNVSWNLSWYNNTLTAYMQKEVGASNWGNITVYAFNSSGNGSLSAGSISDNVQAPAYVPTDYPPATPTSLANTTGNSWVNYTWSSGGGANVTDSYNISWNLTWYNTTLVTYMNDSVGEFGWANISVWAYNSTGNGSLSAGSVSDNTQAGGGTYITTMTTTVYNLITYYGSTTSTAEQFGLDIGSVDYIAMYNGSFYSHTMGHIGYNFTTYHGIGYYVYLNASGSSAYQRNNISDTPYNTQLFNRWNTIGWTNATDTNAEGVAASIGVACKYTSSLNADGVTYTTHTVGFTSNNHAVEKGEGYWVWVNTGVSWGRNS